MIDSGLYGGSHGNGRFIRSKKTLSAYDAAYLDLSIRKDIPIATLDRALENAVRRVEIAIFRQDN